MKLHRRLVLAGTAALSALPFRHSTAASTDEVVIERQYARCRYGQVHMYVGQPRDGSKIKHNSILCFHQTPASGRTFLELMPHMATDRVVMAADTPGYGYSDRPPYPVQIGTYADGVADALLNLGYGANGKQTDLLAYHTGCLIAADLAVRYPKLVRRVVLTAVPYYDTAEKRKASLDKIERWTYTDDPKPVLELWQRTVEKRSKDVSREQGIAQFVERLQPGDKEWWGLEAVFSYDATPTLTQISQPTLLLNPHGALFQQTLAAAGVIPNVKLIDLPELGSGAFQQGPHIIAGHVRTFLGG